MISTLIAILITVVYVAALLSLGLILIKFFLRPVWISLSYSAKLASGFLLGQGIFAQIWLFLGLFSVFRKSIIWLLIILVLVLGFLFFRSSLYGTSKRIKNIILNLKNLSFIWKIILLIVSVLIVSYGVWSLVNPPAGDAEAFYMVLPKIMANSERLQSQPNYFSFSQIGLSGEMHFAGLMLIASSEAAQFFVWFTALSVVLMIFGIGEFLQIKLLGKIVALAVLFTTSTFTLYISGGKVDIFGAAFGLAAYFFTLNAFKERRINLSSLVLTGLFFGFAFMAKFSNLLAVLPGLLVLIIWGCYLFKGKRSKIFLLNFTKSILIMAIFFVLAISPHLFKNWFLFKEPLAPFVFFHSQGLKWAEQSWFSRENIHYILKTYPLALTFGQYPMQGGNLSVLVLAFLPLILIAKSYQSKKTKSSFFQIGSAFLIGVGCWVLIRPGVMAPRYILATLLLTVPLISKAVEDMFLKRHFTLLKNFIIFSLLVILTISFYANYAQIRQYLTMGKADYHKYGRFSFTSSSSFINQKVAQGDRIALFGYYTYFLRSDLLQCLSTESENSQALQKKSSEVWQYFFSRGFRYLVIQKISFPDILESWDVSEKPDFMDIKEVYSDPNVIIFSLEGAKQDQPPECFCQSKNAKAWDVSCLNNTGR